MPKPKPLANKPTTERTSARGSVRGRVRGHAVAARRATVMRPQPVYEILEPLETDFVEEYVPVPPQVRRLRTPMIYRRPIEDRLTLPPRPQVVYVPVPVTRTQRKPLSSRGSGGRGTQRNQGTKNNVRGVMNNVNFKNHAAGRGGRAGRGAASGRGHYAPLPKKSISELDKELEDYMKKSKHPKIVV
ncbi:hypothetical protein Q1695_007988 [Nippostrongylus brasiliensis]|nr:hypothetical protein Q1695_007988 [Nippostrongylus brasiliensis]